MPTDPVSCLPQDYGGFVTLMMLKSTERLIRCAATLAPIIDWSMYGEHPCVAKLTDPEVLSQEQ